MKSKLIRGTAFALLVAALFLFLNHRYVRSDWYRSVENLFLYEQVPQNLQVVNFGSSHGRDGLSYTAQPGLRTFNFALNAQPLFADLLLMQTYQDRLAPGCIVILPVSYFSLYTKWAEVGAAQTPRYYRILGESQVRQLPAYSVKDAVFYRYFPILSAKQELWRVLLRTSEVRFHLRDNAVPPEELENWSKDRVRMHMKLSDPQVVAPEEGESLTAMLRLCKEKGWQPVVVTTPLQELYLRYMPQDFIDTFHRDLAEILAEFPDVPYWDYARDQRFWADAGRLFRDADHLAPPGRELLTQVVLEDCEKNGMAIPQ